MSAAIFSFIDYFRESEEAPPYSNFAYGCLIGLMTYMLINFLVAVVETRFSAPLPSRAVRLNSIRSSGSHVKSPTTNSETPQESKSPFEVKKHNTNDNIQLQNNYMESDVVLPSEPTQKVDSVEKKSAHPKKPTYTIEQIKEMIRIEEKSLPDYELLKDDKKKGINAFRKNDPDLPNNPIFRVEMTIKGVEPKTVYELFGHMDRQPEWNKHCSYCRFSCKHDGYDVFVTRLKCPFPLDCREFIDICYSEPNEEKQEYLIIFTSYGTENLKIPVEKKHTRGFTFMVGYIMKAMIEDDVIVGTKFTFITQSDFGGNIPKAIVKKFAVNSITEFCQGIANECKKHTQERGSI